jgi:hypothetical protein
MNRTREQILEEAVRAVQAVAYHYGPGFNEDGIRYLRKALGEFPWFTDSCYSVDVHEDDEYVDFSDRIIWPEGWDRPDYYPPMCEATHLGNACDNPATFVTWTDTTKRYLVCGKCLNMLLHNQTRRSEPLEHI